jgi:hypothetical protein
MKKVGRDTAKLETINPSAIAPIIPLEFEKKDLPLWRFVLQPNTD